jgi:hypothetical protein
MKSLPRKTKSLIRFIFLCGLWFLLAASLPFGRISAQSCPTPLGQKYAWQRNAAVTVNIDPSYSQTERDAIKAAFTNWQASNGNNSGVTFSFTYNATPISGTNTHQVNRQTPTPNTDGTQPQARTSGTAVNNNRASASTNMDPRVTDLTALTT